MVTKMYLRNTHTGTEFEVVGFDRATGEITLKGEFAPFTEKFDKERFKALGYEQVKKDVPVDAETSDE
jgi:hypothetical protein